MNSAEFENRLTPLRPRLYKTALLYLGSEDAALEAVDEAVYKALRGLKKLREEAYFETWLIRILINECKNELRHRKRFVPLDDIPEESAEDYDRLPMRQAVEKLPVRLREIILLRFFMGLTLAETAKTLDIPQGTAATRQRRALELLRLELSEEVVR